MKKALQGFWRGGLLGGLLGFLGGEVFVLGWLWMELTIGSPLAYTSYISICMVCWFIQIPLVVPCIILGLVLGAFLGIPFVLKLHNLSNIVRISLTVTIATILHILVGRDIWLRYVSEGNEIYEQQLSWVVFKWIVYLLSAAIYGYVFRGEQPAWPKLLFDRQIKHRN